MLTKMLMEFKATALQWAIFHKCITPMTSFRFINNIWPDSSKLLITRRITIHKFHLSGMDCLNKMFFLIYLKFIRLCHKLTFYS